jgi:hypothetical protein
METPIELNDAETVAVAGGLLNNIFVNLSPITNSFQTNSKNTASIVGNTACLVELQLLRATTAFNIFLALRRVSPGGFFKRSVAKRLKLLGVRNVAAAPLAEILVLFLGTCLTLKVRLERWPQESEQGDM